MDLRACRQIIEEARFYWVDESPTRRRNRLAQREYRKRKRLAAHPGPEELDRKIKPPSARTFLQSCGTETGLPSIVQPFMPVGSVGLSVLGEIRTLPICAELTFAICLSEPKQVTHDEIFNAGHLEDNTADAGSVIPIEEAPTCFPIAKSPVFLHALDLSGRQLGTKQLGFEANEYLWPNEERPAMSNPEAFVGPQTSVGSLLCAVNQSTARVPHLLSCFTTDIGSMDNAVGGLHNCGMPSGPFSHAIAGPGSPKDVFGRVLDTCEAAANPGSDSMATEYYAVSLPTNTYCVPTQSGSSSRSLPRVPDSSYVVPLPRGYERRDFWSRNEPKRFREQVLRLAEDALTSEIGHLGIVHGDQSASAAAVSIDQNTGEMGSGDSLTIPRRDIKGTGSFEELKPFPSHWPATGYMKNADS